MVDSDSDSDLSSYFLPDGIADDSPPRKSGRKVSSYHDPPLLQESIAGAAPFRMRQAPPPSLFLPNLPVRDSAPPSLPAGLLSSLGGYERDVTRSTKKPTSVGVIGMTNISGSGGSPTSYGSRTSSTHRSSHQSPERFIGLGDVSGVEDRQGLVYHPTPAYGIKDPPYSHSHTNWTDAVPSLIAFEPRPILTHRIAVENPKLSPRPGAAGPVVPNLRAAAVPGVIQRTPASLGHCLSPTGGSYASPRTSYASISHRNPVVSSAGPAQLLSTPSYTFATSMPVAKTHTPPRQNFRTVETSKTVPFATNQPREVKGQWLSAARNRSVTEPGIANNQAKQSKRAASVNSGPKATQPNAPKNRGGPQAYRGGETAPREMSPMVVSGSDAKVTRRAWQLSASTDAPVTASISFLGSDAQAGLKKGSKEACSDETKRQNADGFVKVVKKGKARAERGPKHEKKGGATKMYVQVDSIKQPSKTGASPSSAWRAGETKKQLDVKTNDSKTSQNNKEKRASPIKTSASDKCDPVPPSSEENVVDDTAADSVKPSIENESVVADEEPLEVANGDSEGEITTEDPTEPREIAETKSISDNSSCDQTSTSDGSESHASQALELVEDVNDEDVSHNRPETPVPEPQTDQQVAEDAEPGQTELPSPPFELVVSKRPRDRKKQGARAAFKAAELSPQLFDGISTPRTPTDSPTLPEPEPSTVPPSSFSTPVTAPSPPPARTTTPVKPKREQEHRQNRKKSSRGENISAPSPRNAAFPSPMPSAGKNATRDRDVEEVVESVVKGGNNPAPLKKHSAKSMDDTTILLNELVASLHLRITTISVLALDAGLALLLAAVSAVIKLHQLALLAISANHHVAFCFTFLYAFPYLVDYVIPWAPPWAPVCLWYAFLVQLFCAQGPTATVAFFRLVLPLSFLVEGVSHHSFLLDLNGAELLLISFILSAMKTQNVFSPIFLMSLATQVVSSVFFGTSIFVQWAQLVLALFSLHAMSVLDGTYDAKLLDEDQKSVNETHSNLHAAMDSLLATPPAPSVRKTKKLDRRALAASAKARKTR